MATSQSSSASACDQFEAALQRLLDGVPAGQLPELKQHAADCVQCASFLDAAQRALDGLALTPAASLSASQREQLANDAVRVLRRVRQRRLLVRVGAVGLAASVLVAALLLWQAEPRPAILSKPPQIARIDIELPLDLRPHDLQAEAAPPMVPLRQAVDEVGTALTALARRTAGEAVENTKSLLPEPMLPPILPGLPGQAVAPKVVAVPANLEPAADSLAAARQGMLDGLGPMARSARRAASLFSRTFGSVIDMTQSDDVAPNQQ